MGHVVPKILKNKSLGSVMWPSVHYFFYKNISQCVLIYFYPDITLITHFIN